MNEKTILGFDPSELKASTILKYYDFLSKFEIL